MLEDKKIETLRNKEMISQYLYERGISSEIIDNPRYESILWKLSNMLRKMKLGSNIEAAKSFLNSITTIEPDGSIIMVEGEGPEHTIVSSKYMYDTATETLKRLRVESRTDGVPNIQTISIYNDDGIEESLGLEQNIENGKYFSKATRVPNRVDIIKIESMKQEGENLERLPDVYQKRFLWAALEDIDPDAETIDPYDIMHFSIIGLPPIYEDLSLEEQERVAADGGNVFALPEEYRAKQLSDYKTNNDHYGRTKAFEKGIAKYLVVKDKTVEHEWFKLKTNPLIRKDSRVYFFAKILIKKLAKHIDKC